MKTKKSDTNFELLIRDYQSSDWPLFAYHLGEDHIGQVTLSQDMVLAIHEAANITSPMLLPVSNDITAIPKAITWLFNQSGLQLHAIHDIDSLDQLPQTSQMALFPVFAKLFAMGNTLSQQCIFTSKEIPILGLAQQMNDFLEALSAKGYAFW